MKILFLNSDKLVENGNQLISGGWTYTLIQNLLQHSDDIEIGVTFPSDRIVKSDMDRLSYYPILQSKKEKIISKVVKYIPFCSGYLDHRNDKVNTSLLLEAINAFKPDIIHVWGIETNSGLVSKYTSIPCVAHIQGILNPYYDAYFPPKWSKYSLINALFPNLKKIRLSFNAYKNFKRHADREKIVCSNIKYYLGRTEWDKNVINVLSTNPKYFYCSEMLRPLFITSEKWHYHDRDKLIIQSSISKNFYKGHDVVLRTAQILKNIWGDNFEWYICGVRDESVFERVVGIKAKDVNVKCLGKVSAEEIRDRLLNSDVYCHLSYIENSPNSVCEAQYLGVPVIAANVGGTSTLLENGSGVLIPANDAYQAASYIVKIKKERTYSERISRNAISTAEIRHSPNKIINELIYAYQNILKIENHD